MGCGCRMPSKLARIGARQHYLCSASVAKRDRQAPWIKIEGFKDHPVLFLREHPLLPSDLATQAHAEAAKVELSNAERRQGSRVSTQRTARRRRICRILDLTHISDAPCVFAYHDRGPTGARRHDQPITASGNHTLRRAVILQRPPNTVRARGALQYANDLNLGSLPDIVTSRRTAARMECEQVVPALGV
jgi:hypothetical protein